MDHTDHVEEQRRRADAAEREVAELRARRDDLLISNVRFEAAERKSRWALADARATVLDEIEPRLVAAALVHSKEAAANVEAMLATIKAEEKVRNA